jgi:glycosyltransferase involved in cell wall biosynthesis
MRVAIDIAPVKTGHKVRGVGMYTKRLVDALERESKRIKEQEIKIEALDFSNLGFRISDFDAIHYPYFDLFFLTLPLKKSAKTIVTIHDVIPLVYPKHYPPGIKGKMKLLIQKFSLQGTSAVITDSVNSKKDVFKYLNYPENKIQVIPLASGKEFKPITNHQSLVAVRKKYSLPDKFVLYVGDVNWNKNIAGLLKAFAKLVSSKQWSVTRRKSPNTEYRTPITSLVLVGDAFKDKSLPEVQELLRLIKSLKIERQVLMPGFISGKDLVAIYNLATVYCQPSFYEGFGLPVLEAMTCGCPVVASKVASLPEICGDAAVMVDPRDYNNIAKGLEKLIRDKSTRNKLIEKGFKQVKKFSWEKTAKETLRVYEKVAQD